MTFEDLLALAAQLRSDTGCPWDRQQTVATMLTHLENEVAELRQAVEKADDVNLAEEAGDVLFNLALILQIGSETKQLDPAAVFAAAAAKIKRRHSWVFGPDRAKVKTAEDAYQLWLENKKTERK